MTRILRILAPNPGLRELEGTNTWIVGDRPAAVVDPGPDDEGHLREVAREAGRVRAILLTHDHPDHAPGARTLAAMTGAPVLAARPPEEGERLRDGQEIEVRGGTIECVATPGHSPDHMAFFHRSTGSLFTGDAVLGRGTSVIDPPEGDLVAYLRSLRRMRELEPRTIHPGHGPLVLDAVGKLDEYLEHRAMREEQVLAALADGRVTPQEMVPAIYGEYPQELRDLAARSILAHLLKLEAEGRVEKRTKDGETRWSISEPRTCARCGRPVRGRARLCGPCSLAALQESG
ncbi:MAG TPA: MBL fold metallo-hydrolase [Actinomycetota bacterium]|nr:MBL fold metallo-hydrolase [Actinomycetota bacterium]